MKTSINEYRKSGLIANITTLANKVDAKIDCNDLNNCGETELSQLQDNLIQQYNEKIQAV
jgi:hypothetical protein